MTEQPGLTLSMLQAIELFRGKQPAEWTEEELIAFRARLQQSPVLVASLGGQHKVDRGLADVAASLTAASQEPPSLNATAVAPLLPPPRSKVLWHTAEAALFLALLAGVCVSFFFLWPKAERGPTTAALEKTTAQDAIHSKTAPVQPLDQTKEPASGEPAQAEITDDHTWQGWAIAAEHGTPWNLKDDWDLTDPSNPQPTKLLTMEGGPVTLTRHSKLVKANHFLEVHVRPLQAVSHPGHIVIRVDDATLADTTIGSGETKWPLYVSLEKWAGKEVSIQAVFTPGEPGQKVAWWGLALVDTQRHVPRAESSLAEELASKDPKIRLFAAKRSGLGGDLAVLPALNEAIHDSDVRIRQAAVAALLRFDDPRARKTLRAALEADRDTALRTMIAVSFAKRPLPGDIPSLLKALQDSNARLRQAAARTLSGLPDASVTTQLVQMLGDSDRSVRDAAASALSLRKGEAVERALLPILTNDSDVALQLHAALYFRANPTTRAIAPLAALLKSDNDALRRQVIQSLSANNKSEATSALASALGDSDAAVRQAAAVALSRRKGTVADAALLAALGGNHDNIVKQHAVAHFQQFPNPQAIQPLAAALGANDEALRRAAIRALGRIPDEAAIDALSIALKDSNVSVRRAAMAVLKQSRHPKAAVVLQQATAPK